MMLLLDTHALLWLVEGSPNLSKVAQTALVDPAIEVFLSVASVWEFKISGKKLTISDPLDVFVSKWVLAYQLDILPIKSSHALAVVGLPAYHKDPFDRILIAQATFENLTLVTADSKFTPYSVPILW